MPPESFKSDLTDLVSVQGLFDLELVIFGRKLTIVGQTISFSKDGMHEQKKHTGSLFLGKRAG